MSSKHKLRYGGGSKMRDDYAKWWMVFLVYIIVVINLILTANILATLENMGK